VAVIDPLLAPATQPRQRLDPLLPIPHLQMLRIQPHLDALADQTARYRIHVVLDSDQTAAAHRHLQPLVGLQPSRRQRPQHRQLLDEPRLPSQVPLPTHFVQKRGIRLLVGKVATAAQEQRLFHRLLEMPMRRLRIAILVRVVRLDLLADQTVVRQQSFIARRELVPLRQVIDRRRHPVAAVSLGHAAQFPQGVLQTGAETGKTLRETDRHRLPVRVSEHQVIHQVRERLAADGHAEAVHVREVRGT
jgi:hypothetical protein